MKKKALVYSLAAAGIAVALFTLPKVVVDNDAETSNSSVEAADTLSSVVHTPSVLLSYTEIDSLIRMLTSLQEDQAERAVLLKVLAQKYREAMVLDTAAFYADMLSVLTNAPEDIAISLEYHYERFTYASDQKKANEAGEQVRNWFGRIPEGMKGYHDLKTKAAMTWVATDQPMSGIMMLREVLEVDPNHREATFNLGVLAMQSGQYVRAIERFSALIKRDSSDIQSLFYLALSQKESGNASSAKSLFMKVKSLESDPSVLATVDTYLKELESTQ